MSRSFPEAVVHLSFHMGYGAKAQSEIVRWKWPRGRVHQLSCSFDQSFLAADCTDNADVRAIRVIRATRG